MTEKTSKEKLAALRAGLAARGLDGFIVPHEDEFQSEYLPACFDRLSWLTGFTGSSGAAAVLGGRALVVTDGRYDVQVRQQVAAEDFDIEVTGGFAGALSGWLGAHAAPGARIGYDPKLHTARAVEALAKALRAKRIELVPVDANPLDAAWTDRPAFPDAKVELFPDIIAGRTAAEKRADIAKAVADAGGHAVIVAKPESVAWLLNIRGGDVAHSPLALSYAILRADGDVEWFIDPAKIPADVAPHLGNQVHVQDPGALEARLAVLAREAQAAGSPVLLDHARAPVWFRDVLARHGASVEDAEDPCLLPRAVKTAAEQSHIVDAHVRDGVAMVRFLKWVADEAPKGRLTEQDVADRLEQFRRMDPGFRDTSFDTISGWAGNGAIVHYRVTPESNAAIVPPGLLLVDSGAQYREGTTDITRTVAVGTPTEDMKVDFTLVLKGHIAVAAARFPEGTVGTAIDDRARRALYDENKDYDHGTGHGVGCYLGVHEEAAGISKAGTRPFRAGMLISNEPGFYKEGAYGIRTENLVLVREVGVREHTGPHRTVKMLGFETVSLAPIDRSLIVLERLDAQELQWLNDYHERVYLTLAPLLEPDVRDWLREQTQPLKKNLTPAPAGSRPAPPAP